MRIRWNLIVLMSVVATLAGLSGCRDRAVPGGSGHYWDGTPAGPEVVRAERASEELSARFASSHWTRQPCSLDMVDLGAPDAEVARADVHRLDGFLLAADGHPAGPFSILLKGPALYSAPASTGALRPDVAEYFGRPGLETAGFRVGLSLAAVPPGRYEVVFMMERPSGASFCETGKQLRVVE